MSNWKTYRALLMSILVCGASRLDAGVMTPYQAVVFSQRRLGNPPGEDSIVIVDMDTGGRFEIPVETPGVTVQGPGTMAVDSDGAVYVYYGWSNLAFDDTGPASVLARLDPTLTEWTTIVVPWTLDYPADMEFAPDGTLILNHEFGFGGVNVSTRPVESGNVDFRGRIEVEGEPRYGPLRIDASGVFTIVAWGENTPDQHILFRQTPESDVAERWEPEVVVYHFVPDLDGSLIAPAYDPDDFDPLDPGKLYRLDFDTKTVDVIFESDLLKGLGPIELDPGGRIVALVANEYPKASIVRVDLDSATAEVIANLDMFSGDLDIRIIPEPEGVLLLVLGCLCLSACLRSRDRGAVSSDVRPRSVCCQAAVLENASNPPGRRRRTAANTAWRQSRVTVSNSDIGDLEN